MANSFSIGERPRVPTSQSGSVSPPAKTDTAAPTGLTARGGAKWGSDAPPSVDRFVAMSVSPAPTKAVDPLRAQSLQFLGGIREAAQSIYGSKLDDGAKAATLRSLAYTVLSNKFISNEVKGAALMVLQKEVPPAIAGEVMGPLVADRSLFDDSGRLLEKGKVTTLSSTGPNAEFEFMKAQYQQVLGR